MALQYIPLIVFAINSLAMDPKKDSGKHSFTNPEDFIASKNYVISKSSAVPQYSSHHEEHEEHGQHGEHGDRERRTAKEREYKDREYSENYINSYDLLEYNTYDTEESSPEILQQNSLYPNPPQTEKSPELQDERHDKCNRAKAAKADAENYLRTQHPTTDEEKDLESKLELYQSDIDYYCNE